MEKVDQIPVADARHRIELFHSLTGLDRVKAFDFDPKRKLLACSMLIKTANANDLRGSVSIWRVTEEAVTRLCVLELPKPSRAVRFLPNSMDIVAGCDNKDIYVLRLAFDESTGEASLKETRVVHGHSDYVRALAVHPSKPHLVLSGADDGVVYMWDTANDWTSLRKYPAHNHYVMALAFNPDNHDEFVTASLDGTTKLWNVAKESKTPVSVMIGEGVDSAGSSRFHPKNSRNCVAFVNGVKEASLVVGTDSQTIDFLDPDSKQQRKSLFLHNNNVSCVAQVGSLLFAGAEDSKVSVVDLNSWSQERLLSIPQGRTWVLHPSAADDSLGDGAASLLFLGADDGMLVLKVHDQFESPDAAPMDMEVMPREKAVWAPKDTLQDRLKRKEYNMPSSLSCPSCPTMPNPCLGCFSWLPFTAGLSGGQQAPQMVTAPQAPDVGNSPSHVP